MMLMSRIFSNFFPSQHHAFSLTLFVECKTELFQVAPVASQLLSSCYTINTSPDIHHKAFVSCDSQIKYSTTMEEEYSTERAAPTPQLLNLIRGEREWKIGDTKDGGGSGNRVSDAEEDKKLELKLGLPDVQGEERTVHPGEKVEQDEESYTALSLGCFLSTNTATTGAKRGFFATVDAKSEGERKKGCCPPSSAHDSAARPLHSSSSSNPQGRGALLPVVGWPPVRSFRRNLTNGSSSKQSPERQNDEAANKEKLDCKRSPLVKINMDGIPIGRKINLAAYDSFQKLSSAVEDLFRGFLQAAQKDLAFAESGKQGAEEKIFSGLLDGTGEYILVYEGNGGGMTLAGNIPWSVFVSTAKRLRVMRSSELPHDLIKSASGRVADN